jgi:N,N'-diacetyllegionaminate synthase
VKIPKIIAEIGVNHNGSVDLAIESIYAAKKAGADAVKFQYFNANKLASKKTPKAEYQKRSIASNITHNEMLKSLELSENDFEKIYNYTKSHNIEFICTPYGIEEAKFLKLIGVNTFKIASLDLCDYFLHSWMSKNADNVIIATGAANLEDIQRCLSLYKNSSVKLTLLHCVSNYPCSDISINLRVLNLLKREFGLMIGFSDHSVDSCAAQLSCVFEIDIIERHFTLSKFLSGPDHQASDTPLEFMNYVHDVKRAVKILGKENKNIQDEERSIINSSRKSLVWDVSAAANTTVQLSNFTAMRPGTGISPMLVTDLIGRKLSKSVKSGEMVEYENFL